MAHPRIKICCIASVEEAHLAIRYGASALGFVGKMPSGPGVIDDKLIRVIVDTLPPVVSTFLLTSETDASEIIVHHERTRTNTIQLVDYVAPDVYHRLRDEAPALKIVQVIHVEDESSIKLAETVSPHVDAILLDSGSPSAEVKLLGGTGRTHNWEISRRIASFVPRPVFLAGGLRPDNVISAFQAVKPFGFDVCSGVRTDGKLDEKKLAAFFYSIYENCNF